MTKLNLAVQRQCFFGSEHGKGESDSKTGVLAQALKKAMYSGNNFTNAKDIVEYMAKKYGTPSR